VQGQSDDHQLDVRAGDQRAVVLVQLDLFGLRPVHVAQGLKCTLLARGPDIREGDEPDELRVALGQVGVVALIPGADDPRPHRVALEFAVTPVQPRRGGRHRSRA